MTVSLLNAIANGDSTHSARHLAQSWFMTDNKGRRLTRTEFLREVQLLGPGQWGSLRLSGWHLVGTPSVAVISYTIDEETDYHGEQVKTRLRSTDTYIRENGRWQMLASHISTLPTSTRTRRLPRRLRRHLRV